MREKSVQLLNLSFILMSVWKYLSRILQIGDDNVLRASVV